MLDRYAFALPDVMPARFAQLRRFEQSEQVRPGDAMPLILANERGLVLIEARWGFQARRTVSAGTEQACINSRLANLDAASAAGESFRHMRRCLVPASGFFQWELAVYGYRAYYCTSPGASLVTFAGLYYRDEDVLRYTIVVDSRQSSRQRSEVPLIPVPAQHELWLHAHDPRPELSATPPVQFVKSRVSPGMATTKANEHTLMPSRGRRGPATYRAQP